MLNLKLRALVRDHVGHEIEVSAATVPAPFGHGAAIVVDDTAWVLLDDQPERRLGGALAWAHRQTAATEVAVITEAASDVLARRAALFASPITIWHAVDRMLVPALPLPYADPAEIDPSHEQFRSVIEDGGAEVVIEHGVLAGEVRGLEVCRVVTDTSTGEVRLEVGVGAHDREAFLMLHGAKPTVEALAGVAVTVATHRRVGADPHPLNRLGAERFLRWLSVNDPSSIGADRLAPAEPPVPRPNLKDAVPCVAVGVDPSGRRMVAVYSIGIDLDLVPFALDARERHAPGADLVLVVPPRDAAPVTVELAARALQPPRIVSITP